MLNFVRQILRPLLLSTALCASFAATAAQPAATNAIQVEHAWSRATPPGAAIGAAYFEITNNSKTADTLIGASSPVAATASVHEMKMANGMMQMRAVPQLPLPAQGNISFSPQGYHVMLNGLKAPLKEGSHFALTLQFAKAGAISVDVVVQAMGAAATDMSHQH
ncbi:copper chaperone PCu(A)C [Silvimonas soli]|uniref:copper chaperone PCu(A)C n=1 Tax=Silvimonas soli TaxID=2980100 RepID=UPI0024B348BC|nr:copper chaperone PCu(A)C [Silvimonas soli]